jgi:hypothetical protein
MLGKTNIGVGGGGLLLKVVGGTTQPTSPAENTIWINTSTAIGSVTVAYNAPATPAEGDVWVKTDNYSSLPLNVSKKDTLIIMPVSVRLYTSGAWADVTVDTKVYTGGSWMELLFIYWQYGAEYADKFVYKSGRFNVTESPTQSQKPCVRFQTTQTAGIYYNAALYFGPIDVTRFNKMTLTCGANVADLPAPIFGITKLYDTDPPPADSPSDSPEANGNNLASTSIPKTSALTLADHELDISSVTGEHYCYIKFYSNASPTGAPATVDLAKIRFE